MPCALAQVLHQQVLIHTYMESNPSILPGILGQTSAMGVRYSIINRQIPYLWMASRCPQIDTYPQILIQAACSQQRPLNYPLLSSRPHATEEGHAIFPKTTQNQLAQYRSVWGSIIIKGNNTAAAGSQPWSCRSCSHHAMVGLSQTMPCQAGPAWRSGRQ